MKKLLVCLLVLLAAMGIAHLRGGVAVMSAEDLGLRSAESAFAHLGTEGGFAVSLVAAFLKPGAFAVSRVGIDPASNAGLTITFLLCWWGWLSLARLAWSISGRIFGWYGIGAFRLWLHPAIPWRPFYRAWLRLAFWFRQHGFGIKASARWAGTLTLLANSYRPGKSMYLGRAQIASIGLHQPVGVTGNGHGVLIGNTGSGKTRFLGGWIGSLPEDASALVIDCGGELSDALVGPLRRAGHTVHVWNPFGISKYASARWNPLDEITVAAKRHGRKIAVRMAKKMAKALVKELNEKQAIFTEGARDFVAALILYVWLTQPEELRNLVTVRQFITLGRADVATDAGQDPFDALLLDMLRTLSLDDQCDGAITAVIARGAAEMKSGKNREGNPFRTSALVATEFIDIPEVAETMLNSDFTLEDLKLLNDIVIIAAPVDEIRSDLAGFIRVFFTQTVFTFQRINYHRRVPCATFLDEAPHIGVENLPTYAATLRKHGIQLIIATQDIPILGSKTAYPDGWKTLLGSAEVRIWLANGEMSTHKAMCEELGTCTVTERISGGWLSKEPTRLQKVERPLLYPDQAAEFLDRDAGNVIVTRNGKAPMKLKYDGYDRALPFWRVDRLPQYPEPLMRRLARRIFGWLFPNKENK